MRFHMMCDERYDVRPWAYEEFKIQQDQRDSCMYVDL